MIRERRRFRRRGWRTRRRLAGAPARYSRGADPLHLQSRRVRDLAETRRMDAEKANPTLLRFSARILRNAYGDSGAAPVRVCPSARRFGTCSAWRLRWTRWWWASYEILGQVKESYTVAREVGAVAEYAGALCFQRAFSCLGQAGAVGDADWEFVGLDCFGCGRSGAQDLWQPAGEDGAAGGRGQDVRTGCAPPDVAGRDIDPGGEPDAGASSADRRTDCAADLDADCERCCGDCVRR